MGNSPIGPTLGNSRSQWQLVAGPSADRRDPAHITSSHPGQGHPASSEETDASQMALWSEETLISCVCGATAGSYCMCLPSSFDFEMEMECIGRPFSQYDGSNMSSSSGSPSTEPKIREDGRPPVPTRKEVSRTPGFAPHQVGSWLNCVPAKKTTKQGCPSSAPRQAQSFSA
jgi:hypothetical protein